MGKMEPQEGLCVGVSSQKGAFVQDLGAGHSVMGRESGDRQGGLSCLNPGPGHTWRLYALRPVLL